MPTSETNPKSKPPSLAEEFFYEDENGVRQDAALHQDILDAGDHDAAMAVSRVVAKRLGLTDEQISKLLKP
jgi:hypothetical protein